MPQRIQRRRTSGWGLPAGAVVIDRTTRWGNPFRVGKPSPVTVGWTGTGWVAIGDEVWAPASAAEAVAAFERVARSTPVFVAAVRANLAGLDLACWCRLGAECHGDVLLALAAEPVPSTVTPPITARHLAAAGLPWGADAARDGVVAP